MTDLVAFLNARLDEDEAAAKRNATAWDEAEDWVRYEWDDVPDSTAELYSRFGSARVLREVEAKRRILAIHRPDFGRGNDYCENCDIAWPCDTAVALAAVYRDHPDYDPAWA